MSELIGKIKKALEYSRVISELCIEQQATIERLKSEADTRRDIRLTDSRRQQLIIDEQQATIERLEGELSEWP
jgi:hypothetical protein